MTKICGKCARPYSQCHCYDYRLIGKQMVVNPAWPGNPPKSATPRVECPRCLHSIRKGLRILGLPLPIHQRCLKSGDRII